MFSSLMPQRKEFFELLAAPSDRVVAGANAVGSYRIDDATAEARAIKMLELNSLLDAVIDSCKRAAKAIEEILIENA